MLFHPPENGQDVALPPCSVEPPQWHLEGHQHQPVTAHYLAGKDRSGTRSHVQLCLSAKPTTPGWSPGFWEDSHNSLNIGSCERSSDLALTRTYPPACRTHAGFRWTASASLATLRVNDTMPSEHSGTDSPSPIHTYIPTYIETRSASVGGDGFPLKQLRQAL